MAWHQGGKGKEGCHQGRREREEDGWSQGVRGKEGAREGEEGITAKEGSKRHTCNGKFRAIRV